MFKKMSLSLIVMLISAGSAIAATVNQVGAVSPNDQGVSFDIDFGGDVPTTEDLANFVLTFSTGSVPVRFLSAVDNPIEGGTAPTYSLFASAGGNTVAVSSGTGSATTTNTSFTGDYLLSVTSNNLPEDNLSKSRFNFILNPSITVGDYSIDFESQLTLRDANGDEKMSSIDQGSFQFSVTPEVAPIPLPAGGLLVLTGLGALTLLRRPNSSA